MMISFREKCAKKLRQLLTGHSVFKGVSAELRATAARQSQLIAQMSRRIAQKTCYITQQLVALVQ
jgi:hypothetical protein